MSLKRSWLAGLVVVAGLAAHAQFNPSAGAGAGKKAQAQAAPPVQAQAQGQGANVYFYRDGIDPGNVGRKALIYVDGQPVVNLSQSRYFLLQLSPGQHTFSGPDQAQAAPMTVESGGSYYFKAKIDRTSAKKAFSIHNVFRIDLVNPKLGEIDVAKLKPQEADSGPKATGTTY